MKWPTSRQRKPSDHQHLPDYSHLSDDELRALLIEAGPSTGGVDANVAARQYDMVCNAHEAHRESDLCFALVNLPEGPPSYYSTLRALMRLRADGRIPDEAENLYSSLVGQAEADIESARQARQAHAAAKASHATPHSDEARPPDMTVSDWLRIRWATADATLRTTLRTIAASLGISLPMTRTRQARATDSAERPKDLAEARRSESDLDSSIGETTPAESGAEIRPKLSRRERKEFERLADDPANGRSRRMREERAYDIIEARKHPPRDPQWHDDDAEGWF